MSSRMSSSAAERLMAAKPYSGGYFQVGIFRPFHFPPFCSWLQSRLAEKINVIDPKFLVRMKFLEIWYGFHPEEMPIHSRMFSHHTSCFFQLPKYWKIPRITASLPKMITVLHWMKPDINFFSVYGVENIAKKDYASQKFVWYSSDGSHPA